MYIEGLKDYVKVFLNGTVKPILSRITIKALEEQLPQSDFFRVHKSYIVNLDHVHSIRKGRIKVADAEIPLSDHFQGAVKFGTSAAFVYIILWVVAFIFLVSLLITTLIDLKLIDEKNFPCSVYNYCYLHVLCASATHQTSA